WARRYHPEFDLAMDFLRASQQGQREEIAERERAQQEKLEQAQALAEEQRLRLEEQARSASRLRGFLAAVIVAALLALSAIGVACLAYRRANAEGANANRQKTIAESAAYAASMNLARAEFESGNTTRGFKLLDAYLSPPKQKDLRDFYWYYLWDQ